MFYCIRVSEARNSEEQNEALLWREKIEKDDYLIEQNLTWQFRTL